MKKNQAPENKISKTNKVNLTEGIEKLISEKEEKVEKSKEVLEPKDEKKKEAFKKKSKKEKMLKRVKKNSEANLIEEVVTKREVKYIYPEDCEDTLSRKKFRQQVRNRLHQLELELLRIEDKESKEYKKAKKAYESYKNEFVKEAVAAI